VDPEGFILSTDEILTCPCMISSKPGTKPGFYEISINFSSQEGPCIEKTINVTVVEPTGGSEEKTKLSAGFIAAGMAAVIALITLAIVIGIVIVKRSEMIEEEDAEREKKEETTDEHKYDDLEKELEVGLIHKTEQ
jgi:hypothetical protein